MIKFILLLTICAIFTLQFSLANIFYTIHGKLCTTSCFKSPGDRYYWCQTETGWDYCSPDEDTSRTGSVCTNQCELYKDYYFCYTGTFAWQWDFCGIVVTNCTPSQSGYGHYFKQSNQSKIVDDSLRCNQKVRGVYDDCECEGYEEISRHKRDQKTFSVACIPKSICQEVFPQFAFEEEKVLCLYTGNSSHYKLYRKTPEKFYKVFLDNVGPKMCQHERCPKADLSVLDSDHDI